uniref:Solute carrier family 16 member 12b n=1 Tax=Cyclopterus lumpus TaxID=8103 RepID=A0A8C3AH17_CYCLU
NSDSSAEDESNWRFITTRPAKPLQHIRSQLRAKAEEFQPQAAVRELEQTGEEDEGPATRTGTRTTSPLDGGGWSWVIIGSVTRCISIFFVEFQTHFGADNAMTSWIHSLVDCTTMLCAPIGSLVGNRWSCRVAVMLGGLLSSFGLLLSSFSTSLELLYLTMGVLTGLGFALCYTPSIAMVGRYFRCRRALAYGVAMSGSGIGTLFPVPVVQLLIESYSWRGALLVLSAFVANLCVCGALLRPIGWRDSEEEESVGEELSDRCVSIHYACPSIASGGR